MNPHPLQASSFFVMRQPNITFVFKRKEMIHRFLFSFLYYSPLLSFSLLQVPCLIPLVSAWLPITTLTTKAPSHHTLNFAILHLQEEQKHQTQAADSKGKVMALPCLFTFIHFCVCWGWIRFVWKFCHYCGIHCCGSMHVLCRTCWTRAHWSSLLAFMTALPSLCFTCTRRRGLRVSALSSRYSSSHWTCTSIHLAPMIKLYCKSVCWSAKIHWLVPEFVKKKLCKKKKMWFCQ